MVCLSFLDVLGTVPGSLRVVLTSFEHPVTDIKILSTSSANMTLKSMRANTITIKTPTLQILEFERSKVVRTFEGRSKTRD